MAACEDDAAGLAAKFAVMRHLHLPCQAIAVLLGIDASTVSHAATLTAALLASAGIPLPPRAPPPDALPGPPANWPAPRPQASAVIRTTSVSTIVVASQMSVVASALPSFTAAWSAAWSRSFWSAYFSAKPAIAWSNLPEPPR